MKRTDIEKEMAWGARYTMYKDGCDYFIQMDDSDIKYNREYIGTYANDFAASEEAYIRWDELEKAVAECE